MAWGGAWGLDHVHQHRHPTCASGKGLEHLWAWNPGVTAKLLGPGRASEIWMAGAGGLLPTEDPEPRCLGRTCHRRWSLVLAQPRLRCRPSLQVVLIISGNLSFLNWLTIVPSIACFDDATLGFLFPSGPGGLKDQVLKMQKKEGQGVQPMPRYGG